MENNIYFPDPIYGLISLDRRIKPIIDHTLGLRLGRIHQLGTLYQIFPYANHYRREHCLGVAYLARLVGEHLAKLDKRVTDRLVLLLQIAGFCHDIGHGPFSHVYDTCLAKIFGDSESNTHEIRSNKIVQYIMSGLSYPQEDIDVVKRMIDPKEDEKEDEKLPAFLFQIVNNTIHKCDIDKFDYGNRDSGYMRYDTSLKPIDFISFISRTRIINDDWVFDIDDQLMIHELIYRRQLFHLNRYCHPQVVAVSIMIEDIFIHLQEISEKLNDVSYSPFESAELETEEHFQTYAKLDDTLIDRILQENNPIFGGVKSLIKRVYSKDFYQHISDTIDINVNGDDEKGVKWNVLNDSSSPLLLLPKVVYHHNGKIIDNKKNNVIYRYFKKSGK